MQLKVGELAQRTGLTVRTLHHFDQIGLLKPSARSESGYRLYSRDDVARLHGIQALRHLGLPLKQIASMLAGDGEALPVIVARQMRALDHQIAQASALRGRLALLMDKFSSGKQPEMSEWLDSLALMATYARYFSADEIQLIVGNWQALRAEWGPLLAQIRQMMDSGVPATDPRVQPLAQHWMGLIHQWLGGNFDLIERWGRMYQEEPPVRSAQTAEPALVHYIDQATALRLAAWQRHFSTVEMSRFRRVDVAQWQQLGRATEALMAKGLPPSSKPARALAAQLQALISRVVGDDPGLLARMHAAMAAEPLLRAGAMLPAPVKDYLQTAATGPGRA
ncbi:MAG: MerR family transcriptional regulator [Burkholderiales bacterium]